MEYKHNYTTIDTHVGGEPLRIITGGIPFLKGDTIKEKTAFFQQHCDSIRQVLLQEPRGHIAMYGCIIVPPVSPDADIGLIFMHNEGFNAMSGHCIVAAVTVAIETGLISNVTERTKVVIDTQVGRIIAIAECLDSCVDAVSFLNVPSFVLKKTEVPIQLLGLNFTVDIAFGGAFYALVHAQNLDLSLEINELPRLQKWGKQIKHAIEETLEIVHPLEREIQGIHGVVFTDRPRKTNSHYRNATILANGQIVRSPCGTAASAMMAILHKRGQLSVGEDIVIESIIGSQLTGRIVELAQVDSQDAIITRIKGKSFITGSHKFIVDPTDPLKHGFLLA